MQPNTRSGSKLFAVSVLVLLLSGCRLQADDASQALQPSREQQRAGMRATSREGVAIATGTGSASEIDAYEVGESASSDTTSVPVSGSISIPIFMYHYVEVVADPTDTLRQRLAISPDAFEGQIRYLKKRGYRTLFVRDVPKILSGTLVVEKPVILTFDDGYEDFYTYAFPLLRKYGVKSTLYVIADRIGTHDYLSLDQLREIARSGLVEIGSHTLSHPDLSALSSDAQQEEIDGSKSFLEKRIDITVRTFAYPSGRYSEDTIALVRAAGYTAAVSTHGGRDQSASVLYTLRRIRPGVTTDPGALASLLGE